MTDFVVLFKSSHEALKWQSTHRCCWPEFWFASVAPAWTLITPPCGIGHPHIRALTMAAVAFEKS